MTAVAHSLEMRPDRRELIRSFNPRVCSQVPDKEEVCAMLTIWSIATNLEQVYIPPFYESHRKDYIAVLHRLRKVKTCEVRINYLAMREQLAQLRIAEVQQVIANWPQLRELNIAYQPKFVLLVYLVIMD